ncbi:MAG: hypothetical protein AAGJ46_15715 [Planctomycetota bacterium]
MADTSFDYFRRNTGLMVFIFGLAILSFVIADPLLQMTQSGGGRMQGGGDVAVSWDGGQFTEEQLNSLVGQRQVLMGFLREVQALGRQTAILGGQVEPQPLVEPIVLPTEYEQGVEEDVVRRRIAADAARQAGMVVSDETIRDYLRDLGYGKVSFDQMRQMLKNRGGGQGINIRYMFDVLREALLARNYLRSFEFVGFTSLPQQRWQDWLLLKDQVVVEAAGFSAVDFVSEVPEPTDQQLEEFYEKYKEEVAAPELVDGVELPRPTPAFATPRRVKLQSAKLPIADEVDRVIDSITDEAIERFYNDRIELFVDTGDSLSDDAFDDGSSDGAEADSDAAFDELLESMGEEEPAEGEAAPEAETEPAEPAEEAAAEDASVPEAGPAEEPAAEPAAEEPATETPAAEAATGEETSSVSKASLFRLAAFQPDEAAEETPPAEAADDTGTPADALFDADDLAAAEQGSDEGDDKEMATDEQPAETDSADEGAEPEVKYLPLDEVREEIRLKLAEAEARDQLPDRMAEIIAPLKRAYDEYDFQMDELEDDDPRPDPPAVLTDLKSFAEENGLEYSETADLAGIELRDSDLGRTFDFTRTDSRTGGPLPLVMRIFGETKLQLFRPIVTYEVTFTRERVPQPINGFIVIKQMDEPRKTPELDEIRADVVKAWKQEQAAELAMARAKEAAEEAKKQGVSLRDLLASDSKAEVVETDPFSWRSTGMFGARRRPTMSQPEKIVAAGPDFMKTVFELGPGELGAVLNHDHTVAYTVRVVQHMSSRAELRSDFLMVGETEHRIYGLGSRYRGEVNAAINKLLFGDAEGDGMLDWKRDPRTGLRGG